MSTARIGHPSDLSIIGNARRRIGGLKSNGKATSDERRATRVDEMKIL